MSQVLREALERIAAEPSNDSDTPEYMRYLAMRALRAAPTPPAAPPVPPTRELLAELVALVRGECPSLLDEDSGGLGRLSVAIDAALAAPVGETEMLPWKCPHCDRHYTRPAAPVGETPAPEGT